LIRHKSSETGLYQQSLLFYAPVNGHPQEFQNMMQKEYCALYAKQTTESVCNSFIDAIVEEFDAYSYQQNYTVRMSVTQSTVLNVGFRKRIQERNQRQELVMKQRTHTADEAHRIITYRDLFETSSEELNITSCSHRNCGGELAVLVTGFWELPLTKYHNSTIESPQQFKGNETILGMEGEGKVVNDQSRTENPYFDWLENSLKVNMPYIVFGDPSVIPDLMLRRHDLPTLFVAYGMHAFAIPDEDLVPEEWIQDSKHVPSRALSKIWLEKMNMVYLASQVETNALFYVWIDAGLSSYRHQAPPKEEWSQEVLLSLPKDRISFCRVEGEYHMFAAGVIVFPRSMVRLGHFLFYRLHERCMKEIRDWRCGSEQFIWTEALINYPEVFHAMSYSYGDIEFLWGSMNQRVMF
jgi:hypothetical protein